MLRFGNLKDNRLFASMKDQAIDSKFVTKLISSAQVKVEGAAFDSRKNVLEYDEVLRQQREVMYKQRDEVLGTGDIREVIVGLYEITASNLVDNSSIYIDHEQVVEVPTLQEAINKNLRLELILDEKEYQELPIEEVKEKLKDTLLEMYKAKVKGIPKENIEDIEKKVAIAIIDRYWTQHIDNMEKLKIGVRYMAYAQVNPLNKYVNDGYEMFSQMMSNIAKDVVMYTLGMKIVTEKKEDLNE